jgi:menaquinone-specific isochorismate synthase
VQFENVEIIDKEDLLNLLKKQAVAKTDLKVTWEAPKLADFERVLKVIKTEIEQGGINKAVPVVFERAHAALEENNLCGILQNVLARADKRIPYGYWTETEGIVGATPEILFCYNHFDQSLDTMALAGTRLSELEKTESLLNDPKEMYEHELVVRTLQKRLKKWGDLEVSPTYVWELGPISHLRTDFTVNLNEKPAGNEFFVDMIKQLHPTPALGISSGKFKFDWLKKIDGDVNRRRFGAPFGVINMAGRSRVLVAIRNIQWDHSDVFLGSGCGVVAQSELEREWHELEIKRKTIKHLLDL